jgi:hypothetical protein
MKVIVILDTDSVAYSSDLPNKYIEFNDSMIKLPVGEGFKFYSPGYVERVSSRHISDFPVLPCEQLNIITDTLTIHTSS